jgi:CheY-like chemotaxis protein
MINLRVLVVDDEPDIRQIIVSSLARDPLFVLRCCASGGEALATAVKWRPDLVLLDEMLPDMDGTAVLARLRSDKRSAPIPIVLMTACARHFQCFKEIDAAGAIAKPIDPGGLAAAIRHFARVEGSLSQLRQDFIRRLETDACALSACRTSLSERHAEPTVRRVNQIAHALAGASGIYGFAGITCESAALAAAAEQNLAGSAKRSDVERALDRLLRRIGPPQEQSPRYSAATA